MDPLLPEHSDKIGIFYLISFRFCMFLFDLGLFLFRFGRFVSFQFVSISFPILHVLQKDLQLNCKTTNLNYFTI